MGITIRCQRTGRSIDMGYTQFGFLRFRIAEQMSVELGNHYNKLYTEAPLFGRPLWFERYDKETDRIFLNGGISLGVINNFLYQSDCEGSTPWRDCWKIYKLVKDLPDNEKIGYIGRSDCATMGDFKAILLDCNKKKCAMEWG